MQHSWPSAWELLLQRSHRKLFKLIYLLKAHSRNAQANVYLLDRVKMLVDCLCVCVNGVL